MTTMQGARIHITGVVQGVGFRPFVYALAHRHALNGWVRNTAAGVDIEITGSIAEVAAFTHAITAEAPPLAHIDSIEVTDTIPQPFDSFTIVPSADIPNAFQPISADMGLCPDCLRELFDPADRRFRYPFINCTHCGPRYTIITALPYDRPNTSMAGFDLCPACAADYHNPLDRRFHAQPVACPDCGPRIWLEPADHDTILTTHDDALQQARAALAAGQILALKGLGGFHLAVDAANPAAVAELRRRKARPHKPFALMLPDLAAVRRHCHLSPAEETLLTAQERPIVLLHRRADSPIAANVAPGQPTLGVMLPYTPLHYLLLERTPGFPDALIMTSGNASEEPICIDNADARARLGHLADLFLLHNRPIFTRADDSLTRVALGAPYPIRRARGYAPAPIRLTATLPPILATGAELKNTYCHTRDHYAFLSPHIGDLENFATLQSFEDGIAHIEKTLRLTPEILAADLHPNYLATRYALARAESDSLPLVRVQHHHAHIAALLAEHNLPDDPIIGLAFDGTGLGPDGTIWGGEVLIANYTGYSRALALEPCPLPGGDAAVRQPWRYALSWLHTANLPWDADLPAVQAAPPETLPVLQHQINRGVNAPLTSSMGRLFDAVATLIGVCHTVTYEGQAAIELEAIAAPAKHANPYPVEIAGPHLLVTPIITAVVADLRQRVPAATIAARFHLTLAELSLQAARTLRRDTGLTTVGLTGGVWQNLTLLNLTVPRLQAAGFTVLIHRQVPANDGGLALGQALIAAHHTR